MRADVAGLFWDDTPPPKVLKEKPKRIPPERTWEAPDYLPGLEQARAFRWSIMDLSELYEASRRRDKMLIDTEIYPNYFLAVVTNFRTGNSVVVERFDHDTEAPAGMATLEWIMENCLTVGFNSKEFDCPIIALALAGANTRTLFGAVHEMIVFGEKANNILAAHKVTRPTRWDHIDIMPVAPLKGSLKVYGGRLHARTLQDLPFKPGTWLSHEQMLITRMYCFNDIELTAWNLHNLREQIEQRENLGSIYGLDLRSKSDAQIAEAVISSQVGRINGSRPSRPSYIPGTTYRYQVPAFVQFRSPLLQWALEEIRNTDFVVQANGTIQNPPNLKAMKLAVGYSTYNVGIGGLHSREKKIYHIANEHILLKDIDVESYYPRLILNAGMFPENMGPAFREVYEAIVDKRVAAKRSGDKTTSDSLKITINGTFGKLGSPYSALYAPNLMIQVTITGQLSLLMLIERLEMAGIAVVSGNTDGILVKCERSREAEVNAIVTQWEKDTSLKTEETEYRAIFNRDVNNYIAIGTDGKVKLKGEEFSNPWPDPKLQIFRFHKNPTSQICVAAVQEYLVNGVPIEQTVRSCTDVRQFVTLRAVTGENGGAVKDGQYFGKVVRWYYRAGETGYIVNAKNGHMVAESEGAWPMMTLADEVPADVDFEWYERKARGILKSVGIDVTPEMA